MGWSARHSDARVLSVPSVDMRAVPGIHVFGSSKPTRLRPVERPDQRSRQKRRFLRSSLRQACPVLGLVAIPAALMIRPDGYVAWASSDGSNDGLAEATAMWSDTKTAVA
ncbi:MAG: hypothetical protein QOJ20_3824 [Mycobacterium sp.]|nr:hypothetical protein [Mycobacterium sp.]